jgi:CRP/FNR family transcriptional regulator, cyclic AMP receptor protein
MTSKLSPKLSRVRSGKETLENFEIFKGLPGEAVDAYSRRCVWKRFETHQPLIRYKDATRDVFFISSGRARATHYAASGREISFRDLGAGDMFGEVSAIDAQPRSLSVVAQSEMLVAMMPAPVLRELMREHEQCALAIMLRMTRLIRCLSERIVEFSTLGVQDRIRAELLRLARISSPGQNTAVIFPVPTHTDIANRISTHREAVTRELSNLCRAGLLERQNCSLIVRDVDKLSRIVSDVLGE